MPALGWGQICVPDELAKYCNRCGGLICVDDASKGVEVYCCWLCG